MNNVRLRPVAPLSILVERLAEIRRAAERAPEIAPALLDAIADAERLAGGLEPYVEDCTTPESAELRALVTATQREDWGERYASGETARELEREMLSGHVEGQFLKTLVHAMRATRVLEVGLFTGYSALAMAEALPATGTLIACEVDPYAAAFAQRAFDASPHGRKIRIDVGPADDSMRRYVTRAERFDLIFIDADKANYPVYFEHAIGGGLLAPGGLVCVDNTLMQGQPYLPGDPTPNGRAIAAFNRLVRDDARVEQVMLPLRDGLTLVRRI